MSNKNRLRLAELRMRLKEALRDGDQVLARAIVGQIRQFVDA